MADWWQQLAPRERSILLLGGLLAILIVAWRFVWAPLQTRSDELEQQVSELTRVLVDVQRAAQLQGSAGLVDSAPGSAPLMTLLDETARSLSLASTFDATRLDGPNAMYVSFRNAPFDVLNSWLTELELEHGIAVTLVSSISFSGTPGLVNGQVLLAR